jgi:hypothetical protein
VPYVLVLMVCRHLLLAVQRLAADAAAAADAAVGGAVLTSLTELLLVAFGDVARHV